MEVIDLICFNCEYFGKPESGCKAFPEGIPQVILEQNSHSKPIEGQKNDLVFKIAKALEDELETFRKTGKASAQYEELDFENL
jgi:hypothetical protein